MSREQASFRRVMDEQISFELLTYKSERISEVTNNKNEVLAATQDVHTAEENLLNSKRNFVKAMEDVQAVREKLVQVEQTIVELSKLNEEDRKRKEKENRHIMGRFFSAFDSTPEQDKEKLLKKLKKLELEMIACSGDIVTKKNELISKIYVKDMLCKKVI